MTYPATNGLLCERTRGWLSLELDGELSDFERALMDAHLRCCDGCREFEREVVALTARLRTAPMEALAAPVAVPSVRRPVRALQVAAAAAAVVVAAGVGSILGSIRGGAGEPAGEAASLAAPASDPLLRDLRVAWLKPPADLGSHKPPLSVEL